MRLKTIKLVGFKSFVDATTVSFPSNLCAVVGPNGCGKSNVIDAVRWVMGESSAKNLRGEQMSDVIFNGSTQRKPVNMASIELVFDNQDGGLGGEYASYAEIAIRRQVTREGQSEYFLNGGKCRRRDITDIFFGTGLGPRSYAIIEQGMISRLIESRPEEIRVFIEEAAGISRYKERRRETESRMRRTLENLERLTDLRDEMGRQLQRLQQQARAAEKYAEYKAEERTLKAQLQAMQWRSLDARAQHARQAVGALDTKLEGVVAEQRKVDASIETLRVTYTEANDTLNEVQSRYYSRGAEVARIEQTIQHQQERSRQLGIDLTETKANVSEAERHLEEDRANQRQWRGELDTVTPELERLRAAERASAAELSQAEDAMQTWQGEWDEFNQHAVEARQQTEVQQSRIQHLEQALQRLRQRISGLEQERERLAPNPGAQAGSHSGSDPSPQIGATSTTPADSDGSLGAGLAPNVSPHSDPQAAPAAPAPTEDQLAAGLATLERDIESAEQRGTQLLEQVNGARDRRNQLSAQLDSARGRLQALRGRQASLEALQQAAAGAGEAVAGWLQQRQLQDRPRLLEQIEVEPEWQRAVETVLGERLQAVCVEDIDALAADLAALPDGRLELLEGGTGAADPAADPSPTPVTNPALETILPTLASKVRTAHENGSGAGAEGSPEGRKQWQRKAPSATPPLPLLLAEALTSVLVAEDVPAALQARPRLSAGQSLITRDGLWLGRGWVRVNRPQDESGGVLARHRQLEQLAAQRDEGERQCQQLEQELAALAQSLKQMEHERHSAQQAQQQATRQHAELAAQLSAERARGEQISQRRESLDRDINETRAQFASEQKSLAEARGLLSDAIESMDRDSKRREELLATRDTLRGRLDRAREAARRDKDAAHQKAVHHESLQARLASMEQSIERTGAQLQQLTERRQSLEQSISDTDNPITDLQQDLEQKLAQRLKVEGELGEARNKVAAVDHEMRTAEKQRAEIEHRAGELRSELEKLKLDNQGVTVRRGELEKQLREGGHNLADVLANLPEGANEDEWTAALERASNRVARLGPINLAAIDEHEQQAERKQYLDAQNEDLESALGTLEAAIRRIDRETRERFRSTFDQVNDGLKQLFPQVFGGGTAYLDMTGDDLLSTGITIMAQPPGKRNSTIHLLSGGEKALTAIALVFSIFRLNPAPFCMLDEVDAPLDDANTMRYARLVAELSKQVQFIFITHNKITMEVAEHLMGVTMQEPGVSRLVTVNIDEAAKLAAT